MPSVPAQPADWAEPGTYPVADGVHRIPLPVPDPALRAVNVYVVETGGGPILVDGGWFGEDGERALREGLAPLGHTLADVRQVHVTHAHHDHYTLALQLRLRYGCRVSLGREERHTVRAATHPEATLAQEVLLHRCGAGDLAGEFGGLLRAQELPDGFPWGPPDEWLVDGQVIEAGAHRLRVVETPGHTRGHVVLHDAGRRLLFSGDHVLPRITPSIGFERDPEPLPLAGFLASLRRVRALPDALLLPAHGPVTDSVHRRVDELLEHHRRRLADAERQVRLGARTARETAAGLGWTRADLPLDELGPLHRGLAVVEMGAHLDVLVGRGLLTACDEDGVRRYARGAAPEDIRNGGEPI